MAKRRSFSGEKIERCLDLTDRYLQEERPRSALRALTVALNYANFYSGLNKESYLDEIKRRAIILEEERSFEDWEYEIAQGVEESAEWLKSGMYGIEGLLP